jgi:hypothetical protein
VTQSSVGVRVASPATHGYCLRQPSCRISYSHWKEAIWRLLGWKHPQLLFILTHIRCERGINVAENANRTLQLGEVVFADPNRFTRPIRPIEVDDKPTFVLRSQVKGQVFRVCYLLLLSESTRRSRGRPLVCRAGGLQMSRMLRDYRCQPSAAAFLIHPGAEGSRGE